MQKPLERGRELFEMGACLAGLGTVAIGYGGGELAADLARAAACGAALAGGEVRFHDGSCAACGVWITAFYGFGVSVFLRQTEAGVTVDLRDGNGQEIRPEKLIPIGSRPSAGSWDYLVGTDQAWSAHRVGNVPRGRGLVCVSGPAGLSMAAMRLGYDVSDRSMGDVPVFSADPEGFTLTVEWGNKTFRPAGIDALDAAVRFLTEPRAIPAAGRRTPELH